MGVTIELSPRDATRLNTEINRLAEQTGQTLRQVLPAQMRLLATDFSYVTREKGDQKSDKGVAENRVAIVIGAVYPSVGWVVNRLKRVNGDIADGFVAAWNKRKWQNAQAILDKNLPRLRITIGKFDGGALHEKERWKKRVTHRLLVTGSYNSVGVYMRKIQKRIGFAKAGFAAAARDLGGTRGIPGWVTRHKGSPGSGRVTGDGKTLQVTMTNNVKYIRKAFKTVDESAALKFRADQVTSVLQRIQDRKVKAAMRKMR